MSVALGNQWGKELADLLGLENTREIIITTRYDAVVIVQVEYLLSEGDSKKITGWMKRARYKLELIDEDEPINLFAPVSDVVEIADTTKHGDTYRTALPRRRE